MKNSFNQQTEYILTNFTSILHWAYYDVSIKYRRTALGPIWQLLSIFLTSVLISVLWSLLFKVSISEYFVRVFAALTIWEMITKNLTDGSKLLTERYVNHINNSNIPIFTYITKTIITNFIIYLHYLPILFVLFLIFGDLQKINLFIFITNLFLVLINCIFLTGIISIVCTRFRDLIPFIASIMSSLTLLTPIVWEKSRLGQYENYAYLNPFTSFIEAIQFPLLGIEVNAIVYVILISLMIINFSLLQLFFKKFGSKLVFWCL